MTTYRQAPSRAYTVALSAARDTSDRIRESTSPAPEIVGPGVLCFLADDWQSGYAVRVSTSELVGVFSLVKGRGPALLEDAIVERGVRNLDCFDGYLPTLYARHGFVEVRREPNWTPGGPDVVFMARV